MLADIGESPLKGNKPLPSSRGMLGNTNLNQPVDLKASSSRHPTAAIITLVFIALQFNCTSII